MSEATTRPSRTLLAAAGLCLIAACSDNDNNAPADLSANFVSDIDSSQSIPTPIAGSAVRVTIRNLAPDNGTRQTPVWVAFHDGSFDTYDTGSAASLRFPTTNALERLAEDGSTGPITEAFSAAGSGSVQGVMAGVLETGSTGPIAPGEQVSMVFRMDPNDAGSRYFSYASMIIPSNDAFVSNASPTAHAVYDGSGNFVATGFTLAGGPTGGSARDAGTEANDELPANTAFFGQAAPDTGVPTPSDVVTVHPGFAAAASGNILGSSEFANANFLANGYEFLSFSFEEVTAPAAANGIASYSLNAAGDTLSYDISVNNLSGDATMMHLHNGAAGTTGPVEFDLFSSITENSGGILTATGSVTLTPIQRNLLVTNSLYLNIHTTLNPTGETRGQVVASTPGNSFTATLEGTQEVPTMPILGTEIRVSAINRAPTLGTFQTPIWIGFHNGGFDIYDLGSAASTFFPANNGLERLAEDGTLGNINEDFTTFAAGTIQSALLGQAGPVSPGESTSQTFRFDPTNAANRYFSYASMIIPSNDAFVANADPMAHMLFDSAGSFVGTGFTVAATNARDAGTEVNDEGATTTAFLGQTTPDTGTAENGVVAVHPGFNSGGRILTDPMFTGADFANVAGYEFLRFNFQEVGGTPVSPRGQAIVTLDGTTLTFEIAASNLTGPATMLHIHEGAAGSTGPVLFDLFADITTNEGGVLSAAGSITVDAAAIESLRAGGLYLNLHTDLNPAGEIRGQIVL